MRIRNAYRELDKAAGLDEGARAVFNTHGELQRPWIPATCTDPFLRTELWAWIDDVVIWLNQEFVFDTADFVPACWPQHPHLIHELAVLADLRWRAGQALTSDSLEDWHRHALPTFFERMRSRVSEHCNERHPPMWPAAGRFARHLDEINEAVRRSAFAADIAATDAGPSAQTLQPG